MIDSRLELKRWGVGVRENEDLLLREVWCGVGGGG